MAGPPGSLNPQVFYGPMLIGVFLNLFLYGVMVVQVYNYFLLNKAENRLLIRYLVIYLVVLETFNSIALAYAMYDTLIINSLASPLPSPPVLPIFLPSMPLVISFISTPVQLFFAWRIKIFTDSLLLPIAISLIAMVSLGGAITMGILLNHGASFGQAQLFSPPLITWLLSSAVTDILITGSLIQSLWRRRTGMVATNNLVNKIIVFTLETGLITATLNVIDVILFLVFTEASFNLTVDFTLSKLYTNVLLASLNTSAEPNCSSKHSVSGSGAMPQFARSGSLTDEIRTRSTAATSLHFADASLIASGDVQSGTT